MGMGLKIDRNGRRVGGAKLGEGKREWKYRSCWLQREHLGGKVPQRKKNETVKVELKREVVTS